MSALFTLVTFASSVVLGVGFMFDAVRFETAVVGMLYIIASLLVMVIVSQETAA